MRIGLKEHYNENIIIAGFPNESKFTYLKKVKHQFWLNCEIFVPKFPSHKGQGWYSFTNESIKVHHMWINVNCYDFDRPHTLSDGRSFCAGKVINYTRTNEWRSWRQEDFTIKPIEQKDTLMSMYLLGLVLPSLELLSTITVDGYKNKSLRTMTLWNKRKQVLGLAERLLDAASAISEDTLTVTGKHLYFKSCRAIKKINSHIKGEQNRIKRRGKKKGFGIHKAEI